MSLTQNFSLLLKPSINLSPIFLNYSCRFKLALQFYFLTFLRSFPFLFLAQGHRYILDTCNKYILYYLRVSQLAKCRIAIGEQITFPLLSSNIFCPFFFFFFSYDKNVLQLSLGASVFFHYSLCVVLAMAFLRSGRKTIAAISFKFKFLHEHQTVHTILQGFQHCNLAICETILIQILSIF